MVDCHIHMVLDGVNWKDAIARHKAAPQEALIRQTLGHYQALGRVRSGREAGPGIRHTLPVAGLPDL